MYLLARLAHPVKNKIQTVPQEFIAWKRDASTFKSEGPKWPNEVYSNEIRIGSDSKKSACNAGDPGSIPWRREWQPTPVFLPGEFCEQRNLAGYCPWGRKELNMVELLTLSLSLHFTSTSSWRNQGEIYRQSDPCDQIRGVSAFSKCWCRWSR